MIKVSKSVGLVSIVLALLFLPAAGGAASSVGAMRVKLAEGDVQMRISETGEWAPVAVNTPLLEGDEIWVPDGGRAAIQAGGGGHIRLDGGTSFQIVRADRESFQFHVAQGYVYVLRTGRKRGAFQFDTPDASVRTFGPSTFRIDVMDGETDISVFNGSVVAESEGGATRVKGGRMLALGAGGPDELSPLPEPDAWERWNVDRDRVVLARKAGDMYLPDELRVYADDFESNGRWVTVEGYGPCWTPLVAIGGDWSPYRHGRWCWRGGDYVWIGDEPWGWAPYHYGRWAFEPRTGWFWIPPERTNVYWAPGYVGWVRTADHVAWVPLAPGEVYYGRGNYGRFSVNITNVNVDRIRVTHVYRNVNIVNGVTIVNQAAFQGGRPAPVSHDVIKTVQREFAERRAVAGGRPSIGPTPASYLPVARTVPESKRPPERVRKIEMRQLRQSRPLVRDANRSAIRPDAAPGALQVRRVETPRPIRERVRPRQSEPGLPGSAPPQTPPSGKTRPDAAPGRPEGHSERGGKPPVAPPRPGEKTGSVPPAAPRQKPERFRPQAVPQPAERVRPQAVPQPAERVRPQAVPQPAERVRPQVAPPPAERVRPQIVPPPAERVRPQVALPAAERARPQVAPPPAERVRPQVVPPPAERARPQVAPPPAERVRPQVAQPPAERVRPAGPPVPKKEDRPEPKPEKPERSREKDRGEERGGEGRGGR